MRLAKNATARKSPLQEWVAVRQKRRLKLLLKEAN
jgi:hypothetical protein